MEIRTQTMNPDGTMTPLEVIVIDDPEFDEMWARTQAMYAELAATGTPYWCIHEGRGVDHVNAYWQNDKPNNKIHRKHGVMCRECGGYIQEG